VTRPAIPKCAACGKTLPKLRHGYSDRGHRGDGLFCTMACGWKFAVRVLTEVPDVVQLMGPRPKNAPEILRRLDDVDLEVLRSAAIAWIGRGPKVLTHPADVGLSSVLGALLGAGKLGGETAQDEALHGDGDAAARACTKGCDESCNSECGCGDTHHFCGCECHLLDEQRAIANAGAAT
jgi:hypothetical protein